MDDETRIPPNESTAPSIPGSMARTCHAAVFNTSARDINMFGCTTTSNFTLTSAPAVPSGIHILHQAAVLEALYDSAASFPQPQCHPVTRQEMLDEILAWAMQSDSGTQHGAIRTPYPDSRKSILWLYGPAGAGKSAIMQTLCQRFQGAGLLGGSFFFKRSSVSQGNARSTFVTLAYQLALYIPQLRAPIVKSAEDDPSVVGRSIDLQLRKLIVAPSASVKGFGQALLLIDGLDECEDEGAQAKILRSICDSVREYPLPLRFIIASRPEPHIRQILEESQADLARPFNITQSFADVERYLREEFARIHAEHRYTMAKVPTPWPSEDILHYLVLRSSGYFIYASTVIRFVDDKNFRPTERLEIVHNLQTNSNENPFHALDQLYTQILSNVVARGRLLQILLAIFTFPLMINELDELLDLEAGGAYLTLRRVHSLLDVPDSLEDFETLTIRMHHASLHDFLHDPKRSREFCVWTPQNRLDLARSMLKAFSRGHKDNNDIRSSIICDVLSYITSLVPPSADLIPLVREFNPQFLWCHCILLRHQRSDDPIEPQMKKFVDWLNKVPSVPQDLLDLWEHYHFITVWNRCGDKNLLASPRFWGDHAKCREILKKSPQLILIFQGCRLLTNTRWVPSFLQVAFLLNIDWHDVIDVLGPLRCLNEVKEPEVMDEEDSNETAKVLAEKAKVFDLFALMDEIAYWAPCDLPALCTEMARAFLRLLKALPSNSRKAVGQESWFCGFAFAHLVASCLPCTELLSDIIDLTTWIDTIGLTRSEMNNIFQPLKIASWLKLFPEPPLEGIRFWEARVTTERPPTWAPIQTGPPLPERPVYFDPAVLYNPV
ncbi:hypothetical protein B0H19DRAFT_190499 [Mycena capillaripes]|nr:hypothetical protein B0H19DRAFT_190499 [Mycena capillaripes]